MGMQTLFSDSRQSGNPNPARFKLIRSLERGDYLLTEVVYPDCTNFEGRKLMVFKGLSIEELESLPVLDPHFFRGGLLGGMLIARFRPDLWAVAESFIAGLAGCGS